MFTPGISGAEVVAEPRRKRRWLFPALVIVGGALVVFAILAVVSGWDQPLTARSNPETEDAYADGEYTPLSARVQGYVRRLDVDDNQPVRVGQPIAELVDDDYRAAVASAEAQLDAARAQVSELQAQADMARLEIAETRSETAATAARASFAAEQAARQRALLPTDVGLRRNFELADADRLRLAAQTAQGDAQTTEHARQLDVIAAEIARAQAAAAGRQADLDLARLRLGYTVIRAPQDGVVGTRQVRVGTLVSPGSAIIDLTPLRNVWVNASFSERQITDIRVGQPARVRADAFPDVEISGHVDGISPLTGLQLSAIQPDNTTGNYTKVVQRVPVKITLDHPNPLDGLLRPGMSVLARIETGVPQDVKTVR